MNKGYRPIFFHEFIHAGQLGEEKRRRYWARSYLGYPPLRVAEPNTTHQVLAELQKYGRVNNIITQVCIYEVYAER